MGIVVFIVITDHKLIVFSYGLVKDQLVMSESCIIIPVRQTGLFKVNVND